MKLHRDSWLLLIVGCTLPFAGNGCSNSTNAPLHDAAADAHVSTGGTASGGVSGMGGGQGGKSGKDGGENVSSSGGTTGIGGATGVGGSTSTGGSTNVGGTMSTGGATGYGGMVDAGGGDRDAGGIGGSDAAVGDALRDVVADGARDGAGGSGDSGDAVWDGPAPGGPVCGAEIDNGALTPSSPDCDVAPLDAAALCASTGPCPVGATAYMLSCTGGAYGPWLVPSGSDGASMMLVTNTGSFVTRLFSIAPGAARVENVPALTSASNVLAVDPATGNRTIFAG